TSLSWWMDATSPIRAMVCTANCLATTVGLPGTAGTAGLPTHPESLLSKYDYDREPGIIPAPLFALPRRRPDRERPLDARAVALPVLHRNVDHALGQLRDRLVQRQLPDARGLGPELRRQVLVGRDAVQVEVGRDAEAVHVQSRVTVAGADENARQRLVAA